MDVHLDMLLEESPAAIVARKGKNFKVKLNRDSLKQRLDHGLPGSRRHRRWMNSVLAHVSVVNEQDMYLSEDDLDEDDVRGSEWKSYFSGVQDSAFLDGQSQAPASRPKRRKTLHRGTCNEPHVMFTFVDRHIRPLLKQQSSRSFVQQLESILKPMRYCHAVDSSGMDDCISPESIGLDWSKLEDSQRPLVFEFKDPYHRMLCHGVCQFYGLKSFSKTLKRNRRFTFVKKRESTDPIVSRALSQVSFCSLLDSFSIPEVLKSDIDREYNEIQRTLDADDAEDLE